MILLGSGDSSPLVREVKKKLGVYPVDEDFNDELAARIRGVQNLWGMEVTGLIEQDLLDRLSV